MPERAGISSLSAVEHCSREGKPWARERAGACRDRPEPTTGLHDKRPLFAVFLSVGGIEYDAVFRVLGGDVVPPCERNKKKKGRAGQSPSDIYVPEPQEAQKGGRRWQRVGGQPGAPGSGEQHAQPGRWVRTGIGAPEPAALAAHFLYGPSANGENRGGDGSKRGPMILSECHREVRKQRAKPVLVCVVGIWELSISRCPFLSLFLHGHLNAMGVAWKRPETEDAGNKGRKTCQTELA